MKKTTKYGLIGITGALVIGWNTWGLNYMVNKEVSPVTAYYSIDEIAAGTLITEDLINSREVPAAALPPNVIKNKEDIVGKYTLYGFGIPANSYFYDDKVLAKEDMPNSSVLKLKDGEFAFPLLVDLETSLGNGIVPDTKVNLAFRGFVVNEETNEQRPIYGIIAEDILVTSVKDNNAGAVFNEDSKNKKNAEQTLTKLFTFAVDPNLNDILNKAILLGEVRPVAKGKNSPPPNASEDDRNYFSTEDMVNWIESQSVNPADLIVNSELADGSTEELEEK